MHGPADLERPGKSEALRPGSALACIKDLLQGPAFYVLHDDVVFVRQAEIVVDLRQVRVREPGEDPCLCLELGERLLPLVFRQGVGPQLLCGTELPCLPAVRDLVHASHPAAADYTEHLISVFEKLIHVCRKKVTVTRPVSVSGEIVLPLRFTLPYD